MIQKFTGAPKYELQIILDSNTKWMLTMMSLSFDISLQ
jgi:hypothetical protein